MELFPSLLMLACFQVKVTAAGQSTSTFTSYKTNDAVMLPLAAQFSNIRRTSCAFRCLDSALCRSFAYNNLTRQCTLGSWLVPYNTTIKSLTTKIYTRGVLCNNTLSAGTCLDAKCQGNFVTLGNNPTFEPFNPGFYTSCRDVIGSDPRKIVTLASGLIVMCDTVTDGGGWTVFQRRVSGTVDFYRGWEEYKRGFGDYGIGNFYLGNENIHCLNSKSPHELRVDIVYNSTSYYAKYSSFQLLSEAEGYRLLISGYSGTAGDDLAAQNNQTFSTYDRDTDTFLDSCAILFLGAWWYSACHTSNLNGMWGSLIYGQGLNWLDVTGYLDNVVFSEMKMRPL